MRTHLLFVIVFFGFAAKAQDEINKTYNHETILFLNDFFNYSYRYSIDDYRIDSSKLAQTTKDSLEFEYLKNKIDTSDLKFNFQEVVGRYKFDSLVINKDPIDISFIHYCITDGRMDSTSLRMLDELEHVNDNSKISKESKYTDTWTNNYIDAKFISTKELKEILNDEKRDWKYFFKIYGVPLLSLAKPIFNNTYEYAYFEWSIECGGLCGVGYAGFYKKVNGRWSAIKICYTWIS